MEWENEQKNYRKENFYETEEFLMGKMGRPRAPGVEDIRYTNPITGVISSKSQYINEQGIKKTIAKPEYKINNKWVKKDCAPHNRENERKRLNSKRGYFCARLNHINKRVVHWKKRGKLLQGENEFEDDRRGRCDKLMAHYDKQVERYGEKCPMTHIPFTMNRAHEKFNINTQIKIFSNISPDRIFNPINYTEQNLIFTSQLWNYKKGDSPMWQLELALNPEWIERYKAIVMERFPDQEYVL